LVFDKDNQFEYGEEPESEKDDSKYLKTEPVTDNKKITPITNNKTIHTALIQEIPYELFIKICEAKKVGLQVGPALFNLNKSDLESFRDLRKLITQEELIVD